MGAYRSHFPFAISLLAMMPGWLFWMNNHNKQQNTSFRYVPEEGVFFAFTPISQGFHSKSESWHFLTPEHRVISEHTGGKGVTQYFLYFQSNYTVYTVIYQCIR